ncbi:MAG: hypothetical protein JO103_04765 [Candidatus Eremiobacteraeota bacterium]|nr:hypothetical protein [Candidatus Eremiobacteraeota bacterium]
MVTTNNGLDPTASPLVLQQQSGVTPPFQTTTDGLTQMASSDPTVLVWQDPAGRFINSYDATNGNAFALQLDLSRTTPGGQPIMRAYDASGNVSAVNFPDVSALAAGQSATFGAATVTLSPDSGTDAVVSVTNSTGTFTIQSSVDPSTGIASVSVDGGQTRQQLTLPPAFVPGGAVAMAAMRAAQSRRTFLGTRRTLGSDAQCWALIGALIALIIAAIAIILLFPWGTLFRALATLGGRALTQRLVQAGSVQAATSIIQRILLVLGGIFSAAMLALWHSIQTVCASTPVPRPTATAVAAGGGGGGGTCTTTRTALGRTTAASTIVHC